MPSLLAVSELATHMPCPHYMQFWSLFSICHAIIICRSGVYETYVTPLLNPIPELLVHKACPQLLLYIALYYFVSVCITAYLIAL